MNRTCLIVPVYNHPDCLAGLIKALSCTGLDCLMVNDGSSEHCSELMRELARDHTWLHLLERSNNGGKGAAVKTGMLEAACRGYTHALQIDADGQHDIADIQQLLALSEVHPDAVISGAPYFEDIPAVRFYGRYLTHVLVWVHTLSLDIKDSMCGFRIYPLRPSLHIINNGYTGDHMDFDSEILVRLHWANVPVVQFKTLVSYPMDGISHFRGLADNVLITWMHIRLFFGMLARSPRLLARKMSNEGTGHG